MELDYDILQNNINKLLSNNEYDKLYKILSIVIEEINKDELYSFIKFYKNNFYIEYTNEELYIKKTN